MKPEDRKQPWIFTAISENSHDLIAAYSLDLQCIYCNEAFLRFFAVLGDSLSEKTFDQLLKQASSEEFKKHLLAVREKLWLCQQTGEEQLCEESFNSNSHARHYFTRIIPEKNENGEIIALISVTRDNPEIIRDELELLFRQSLAGIFFMMLDEPVTWNASTDKEKTLEYIIHYQRMTRVNQAMLDQYRATENEFLGLTPAQLFAHDLDYCRHILRGLFDRGRWHVETKEQRLDGSSMWVFGDYICMYDEKGRLTGHFGVQTDITERKENEEYAKQLAQMVDVAPNAIMVHDFDGNILYANERTFEMHGYNREKFIALNLQQIDTPESRELIAPRMQEVGKKGEAFFEVQHFRKDGSTFPMEAYVKKIDWYGRQAILSVAKDITERKRAEEELRFLSRHDSLTNLYSRYYCEELINSADINKKLPIRIIMADLNGLKLVNDSYGCNTGDEMLRRAALIIKQFCREGDIVARWGGDEFVVLMPGASAKEVNALCQKINEACAKQLVEDIPVSMTLGIATKTDFKEDLFDTLREAEDNLTRQKLTEDRSAKNVVLQTLLKTLAEKSYETEAHTRRMQEVAQNIGRKLNLSDSELSRLHLLITLHDIGKINISEKILTKQGSLSEEEWSEVKRHPEIGFRIARSTDDFRHVAEEILCHHERWDGRGYPQGLNGDNIPLLSRITSIADAFEVMTNGRPYKRSMSKDEIKEELKNCAGSQFDPSLIELFLPTLD